MGNLVFLASKGIQAESYFLLFELQYVLWKAITLAQNWIKIISDKSNSVAIFLRIKTDIEN